MEKGLALAVFARRTPSEGPTETEGTRRPGPKQVDHGKTQRSRDNLERMDEREGKEGVRRVLLETNPAVSRVEKQGHSTRGTEPPSFLGGADAASYKALCIERAFPLPCSQLY